MKAKKTDSGRNKENYKHCRHRNRVASKIASFHLNKHVKRGFRHFNTLEVKLWRRPSRRISIYALQKNISLRYQTSR
ncbi:CLUMA_CG003314, isoform A [Clunio marinus]|uniref:CLUMA_CG003314, isoform A n=1 Tax=Clunio marinus TaxID=568069 RepID=A0A1J1HQ89_9DIPT|nr:CLUMA_CG003314, isoform A [Clunio marinus]